MTKDMLDESYVVSYRIESNRSLGIPDKQKIKKMFIIFFLTAIYTIAVTFIFKKQQENFFNNLFDFSHPLNVFRCLMVIATIVNLLCIFVIKIMSSNRLYLNHMKFLGFINFLRAFSKSIIFAFGAVTFIAFFIEYLNERNYTLDTWFKRYCGNLYEGVFYMDGKFDPGFTLKVLSFTASALVFLPTFFYLLGKYITIFLKYFTPIVAIVYLRWVFSPETSFKYYTKYDEKNTKIEYREFTHPNRSKMRITFDRIGISILVAGVVAGIVYMFYKYNN